MYELNSSYENTNKVFNHTIVSNDNYFGYQEFKNGNTIIRNQMDSDGEFRKWKSVDNGNSWNSYKYALQESINPQYAYSVYLSKQSCQEDKWWEISEFEPSAPFNCICIATGSVLIETTDDSANSVELFTGNQHIADLALGSIHQIQIAYIMRLGSGNKPRFAIGCSSSRKITIGSSDERFARMEFVFIPTY